MPDLPAIALEGPKGVGKTATGSRRASTTLSLDDVAQRELLAADPSRLDRDPRPVFIDEWQRYPEVWDLVRHSVDRDPAGGRFLIAGSATPARGPIHSGAGRIVRLRMRPMSLAERGLPDPPTVSLAAMLAGDRPAIHGQSSLDLPDYAVEVVASGLPAIRTLPSRARRAQLDGYLARISDHDFPEQGRQVRRPASLRSWLAAYAAATSTTATYNTILAAATPGESDKPSKVTTIAYRDVLKQLWLIDEVPGWMPQANAFSRLTAAPKHHLADPALAARLLNATEGTLLRDGPTGHALPREGSVLGGLFESLVTLSVQVYAQAAEATVSHLRDRAGEHEVDLVVEGHDGNVVAFEVKLAPAVTDSDVKHLRWLAERLGDRLADSAVITSGREAYRRRDGVAVIPAALLGP
ncbi:MAG: ATP-binding protein [Micromonosporaceae bacterium]